MKAAFVLAIFACSLAAISASCIYSETDGQPLCTPANAAIGKFRNNYDPNAYWECTSATNQPATAVRCPAEGYVTDQLECVPWTQWQWVEPCDPPSMVAAAKKQ